MRKNNFRGNLIQWKLDEIRESIFPRKFISIVTSTNLQPLTPNILVIGEPTRSLKETDKVIESRRDISRRLRYFKLNREQLRKRCINEYLTALNERHKPKNRESCGNLKTVCSINLGHYKKQ